LKLDACDIIEKIRSGKFKIVEVYLVFSVRAAKLGLENGWLADVCLQEGLEEAKTYQKLYEDKRKEN
jgi:hypothetical protein